MIKTLRIVCLQTDSCNDWKKNFDWILKKISGITARRRPHLIALPENFIFRGNPKEFKYLASEVTPFLLREFRKLATRHRISILLGSLIETVPNENRFYNTSILISEKGKIAAVYRKIHLFDIALKDVQVKESKYFRPGKRIVTGKICGVPVGLSICYDLRFPELFRALASKGAKIIFVPSNFTAKTGQAHWETLLRARAIENQVFIVAPAQPGANPSTGIASFGTTLIVDPWGRVLARGSQHQKGIIYSDLDLGFQGRLRKIFPVLTHCRV